jgi:hypothetical protein
MKTGWLKFVTDKGYHSNETMVDLKEFGIRGYISEPQRGRRNWIGNRNVMPFMRNHAGESVVKR